MDIEYGFKFRSGRNPWTNMVVMVENERLGICVEYDDGSESRYTTMPKRQLELGIQLGYFKQVQC